MALVLTRTENLQPNLVDDLLDEDLFPTPTLLDWDGDLVNSRLMRAAPSVNIIENPKDFQIQMAAPGLEKKDFKIEVDNGTLTISAEKKKEEKEEGKNFTRKEYSYNCFSRSFNLPDNSLPDKLNAEYNNGILNLSLPKKEVTVSKPKKEIKVS
ncbi:MAG: Hsp20/alpha crystallin family protein [Bacteroidia bacterium]